ncbi:MAG: DNA methyltransferase [Candidatus Aenigmatarchaeota archaeon]|nr:methyltransferase domain-containing protein [Candidatus Aenigmarchaeota archaeon]
MTFMIYGFLLGKNPELSLAEIYYYLKNRNIDFEIRKFEKDFVIISTKKLDEEKVINDLGGTIKIAEYVENIENLFVFDKIRLGLSVYPRNRKLYDNLKKELTQKLKDRKIKYIFISPKFHGHTDLKHFEVLKKIIRKNGIEIIAFFSEKNYFFKTLSVHDPSKFKERDVGRPRQRTIYSISPRLAKILINLSSKPGDTMLDPFCGIGTIIQEALLIGVNAIGFDKNEKCIQDAKTNLNWLMKKYQIRNKFSLLEADSTKISNYLEKNSIDSIATEPYLGPPLKSKPKKTYAEKIINDLYGFYEDFLLEAEKVLKPKGKASIVFPNFLTKEGDEIKMDIYNIAKKTKFKLLDLFDGKKSIIDADQKQMTRREIVLLEKG